MTTSLEQNVNTRSRPSDLKITDVRIANLAGIPMRVPPLFASTPTRGWLATAKCAMVRARPMRCCSSAT